LFFIFHVKSRARAAFSGPKLAFSPFLAFGRPLWAARSERQRNGVGGFLF